jgi:putative transposase
MSQNPFTSANLGFKFKLLPTKEQAKALDHQMFVSNQAYNICLNLFKKQSEKNQKLEKHEQSYKTAVQYDKAVKSTFIAQKIRDNLSCKTKWELNF